MTLKKFDKSKESNLKFLTTSWNGIPKRFDEHASYWANKNKITTALQLKLNPFYHHKLDILDLGCGGGRLVKSLSFAFNKAYGLDCSKELIRIAQIENPDINFVCGDFQSKQIWKSLCNFDVIVSNCAIRKDYCPNLIGVINNCYNHLNACGHLVLRIQAFEDLRDILPEAARENKFYKEDEIRQSLCDFSSINISHETYLQKFSSVDYIEKFLNRINIDSKIKTLDRSKFPRPTERHYYIVTAKK